jgi:hypothetical protein
MVDPMLQALIDAPLRNPNKSAFGLSAGGKKKGALDSHAAAPGTGPEGETCKTCRNLERVRFAKSYLKCGLMRSHWTGGPGTDVKAGDAACSKWMPR